MESHQQKRKLQDETEETSMNKKQHSDTEITFSNIGADSTHIEDSDEEDLVKTLIEKENQNSYDEEGEIDDNLVETVVSACDPSSEEKSSLYILIKSLQDIVKRKDDELTELKSENLSLVNKVSKLEDEIDKFKISAAKEKVNLNRYKRTILNLNKVANVKDITEQRKDTVVSEDKNNTKQG